jgi:hypothetical protein
MDENKKDENVEETTNNVEQQEENKEEIKEKKPNKVAAWFKNTWNTIYNKLGLKKLIIISYIALGVIVLALIISVSAVGANNGKLKKKSANNNATTTGYSSHDEKLFSTWKEGVLASLDYEGDISLDQNEETRSYTGDTLSAVTTSKVQEMILSDGQYAFYDEIKKDNYTDGQISDTGDKKTYYMQINDGGTYKFTTNDYSGGYYVVDSTYYKRWVYYIDVSYFTEVLIAGSANTLDEIELLARTYSFYDSNIGLSDFEVSIEKNDGIISLNVKYSYVEPNASSFDYYNYDVTISVNNGYISKIVYNEEKLIDNISSVDQKDLMVKTYEYKHSVNTENFNSIVNVKDYFSTDMGKGTAGVDYYLEGGLRADFSGFAINEPIVISSIGDGYSYDWYIDEARTTLYTNQVVTSEGLKLYGKLKPDSYLTYFIMVENVNLLYPDNYPTLFKDSNYKETTVQEQYPEDAQGYITSHFSDYNGKITMDGKEYTVEELSQLTFEAGKYYVLNYTEDRNALYDYK